MSEITKITTKMLTEKVGAWQVHYTEEYVGLPGPTELSRLAIAYTGNQSPSSIIWHYGNHLHILYDKLVGWYLGGFLEMPTIE